ncbi:carboxylate-amine ligase [Escherichia coli]|uniref:Carboxylate-amine ligase n=1 Tax=Escherichia coli TaxID=562 RepID=A0A2X1LTB9_ECOLX|nr:carboxylate-amine ligase [Escherichia coli]
MARTRFRNGSVRRYAITNAINARWKNFGYLIQQATVFGQHVHVGCASGDDAIYLLHGLSRFVPHFIALSAASPYMQGTDTRFASSTTEYFFRLS